MNHQFDALARSMALSVTRRQALRRFGVGIGSVLLATFGLADNAQGKGGAGADRERNNQRTGHCKCNKSPYFGCDPANTACINICEYYCSGGY